MNALLEHQEAQKRIVKEQQAKQRLAFVTTLVSVDFGLVGFYIISVIPSGFGSPAIFQGYFVVSKIMIRKKYR